MKLYRISIYRVHDKVPLFHLFFMLYIMYFELGEE